MNKKTTVQIFFYIAVISFSFFSLRVILGDDFYKAEYIGDDSYYYLNLARNFVDNGVWSFDRYGTITTGFHLINAYLISLFYYVFHDYYFLILPGFYFSLSLLLIYNIYKKIRLDRISLLLFSLLISSYATVINVISFMEWIWVIISVLLGYNIFSNKLYSTRYFLIVAFFGTLVRTEYILFPLSVVICFYFLGEGKGSLKRNNVLFFLAGGSLGICFITFHNYLISGYLLQSSADIKLYRSLLLGINPLPFIYQAVRSYIGIPRLNIFIDPGSRILFYNIILMIGLLSLGFFVLILKHWFSSIKKNFKNEVQGEPKLLSSILLLIFITFFYSFNSFAMQIWYSSMFVVPSFVCLEYLLRKKNLNLVSSMIGIFIIVNILSLWFSKPFNFGQEKAVSLAKVVNEQFPDKKLAAWDSGILGYYVESRVVNLDGLVNNEVIEYIKNNRLIEYIIKKEIEILIQSPPINSEYYGFEFQEINKILQKVTIRNKSGEVFQIYEILKK